MNCNPDLYPYYVEYLKKKGLILPHEYKEHFSLWEEYLQYLEEKDAFCAEALFDSAEEYHEYLNNKEYKEEFGGFTFQYKGEVRHYLSERTLKRILKNVNKGKTNFLIFKRKEFLCRDRDWEHAALLVTEEVYICPALRCEVSGRKVTVKRELWSDIKIKKRVNEVCFVPEV